MWYDGDELNQRINGSGNIEVSWGTYLSSHTGDERLVILASQDQSYIQEMRALCGCRSA